MIGRSICLNTKNLHCLCRYQDSWDLPYVHSRTPLREHRECQPLVSRLGWFLNSLLTFRDRHLYSDPACHISNIPPLNDSSSSFCLRCVTYTQSAVTRFDHWGSSNLLDTFFLLKKDHHILQVGYVAYVFECFFLSSLAHESNNPFSMISTHYPSQNYTFMWLLVSPCLCRYRWR